jgi:beta-galactosidase/beta-glucuronidase
MRLKTKYEIGEIPHNQHPCPQSMRENWLCLNGEWSFFKQDLQGNKSYEGKILVPFSPETLNSGVAEDFVLKTGETLVYTRTICVEECALSGCVKLHFGGVDCDAEVFVNGKMVGKHHGGYTAFAFEIANVLNVGENELKVVCKDEGTRDGSSRGKQSDTPGGIW